MTGINAMILNIDLLDNVLFPLITELTHYCNEAHNYLIIRGENGFKVGGVEIEEYLAIKTLYFATKLKISLAKTFFAEKRHALIELKEDNIDLPDDEAALFHNEFFKHHRELNRIKQHFAPGSRILYHIYSNPSN